MMQNHIYVAKDARGTSRWAANRVMPKTGSIRASVDEYIVRRGLDGATDNEMQKALHMSGDTQRPSRVKLLRDGLIIDSGTTRINSNGNPATVWRAIDTGMMF